VAPFGLVTTERRLFRAEFRLARGEDGGGQCGFDLPLRVALVAGNHQPSVVLTPVRDAPVVLMEERREQIELHKSHTSYVITFVSTLGELGQS
jgi:hypothetical protein